MALNVTIDGFCALSDGSPSNANVRYQCFFYENGTGSSPSTWNDVRVVENSSYFNCNLGDLDFLGQTGLVMNDSRIIVVFWRGPTIDRNSLCTLMEEWGAFEIVVDGSDTYTNPAQVKVNIAPNLSWTLQASGYVGVSYNTTNSSNDVHTWNFSGTDMYHWRSRYGEDIQLINTINNTDYDWDDGNQDIGLPGAAVGSHDWSASGAYTVEIVIEDECQTTVTGTDIINIYNNAPVPDITCLQAVGNDVITPDTVVTFQYSGTDPDSKITSIDWIINDATDTTNNGADVSDIIPHSNGTGTAWCGHTASAGAFINSGGHVVEIVVHWYDGFSSQTINYDETFTQLLFSGPSVDFDQDPAQTDLGVVVSFNNVSTNIDRVGTGLPGCENYDWYYYENNVLTDSQLDTSYGYIYSVTPTSIDAKVKLCANWNDGFDNHETCTEKDIVFDTTITITEVACYYNLNIIGTSDNGSLSGYSWEVYSDTVSGTGVGPWTLIWESPTGLEQEDKTISFASDGYYKVIGYAHGTGTTTSDDEIIYVSEVCADECELILWNGTGVDDIGGDWQHSDYGFEASYAKHSGTNGLDATKLKKNNKIRFTSAERVNIEDYDLLTFMLNIRDWPDASKGVTVDLHRIGGPQSNILDLKDYADLSLINTWQKIYIPLEDFEFPSWGSPGVGILVDRLDFVSKGYIDLYVDDIQFGVGQVIKKVYAVSTPEFDTEYAGDLNVRGEDELVGIDAESLVPIPNIEAQPGGKKPAVRDVDHLVPGLRTSVPIPNI